MIKISNVMISIFTHFIDTKCLMKFFEGVELHTNPRLTALNLRKELPGQ